MRVFIKNPGSAEEATGTGKLNLLVSGFGQQDIVPVDDIVHAIDVLPSVHLEGLREIVYLPQFAPMTGALCYPGLPWCNPQGEFIQNERRVYVYSFDSRAMLFHMLFHEIGHFVFYLVIGSRVKKRWVTEISSESACVTAYASSNPREDFAETYAYYVRHPQFLKKEVPHKYAFMRDYVFSGNPEHLKERVRGASD